MKYINSTFLHLFLLGVVICACNNDDTDKEKEIILTVYEETGFGSSIMSDYVTEPLLFSDTDNEHKQLLIDIIIDGIDFEYERGYRYTFKAKKIWMTDPPQDVSSVKYNIEELLSKERIITSNKEEELKLTVAPNTVKFLPCYRSDLKNQIHDALSVKEVGTEGNMAIVSIENFDYESGYEYTIRVKKSTQAEPYSIKYTLLEVISKTKQDV
ncbi:MAG: DUF4377 domain-containing protein [Bacteroidales bacterium]